ncbi:putative UPF0481 protein At3g02645 [Gastrolobium bilobum]|uniref:putative UPF0481 protein At3g02645 n=1 Tax=Gastrolobium bilobum TaxID=150636 RepID=UPI002AB0D19F|nr:putative UPF0481 protein At3g02645 [Gastrolobium bilobum]
METHVIFSSKADEDSWFIQLDHLVSETHRQPLTHMGGYIRHVPKSLSFDKPEAFTPQLIAIGPYNHFLPELYPMERFKILSAKKVLNHFNKHDLKQLVEKLYNTGPSIRAYYNKSLDLKDHNLLYTMVIDGLFLLNLFNICYDDDVSFLSELDLFLEISRSKHSKDAIIRDVLMVENQIPTFILGRILTLLIESSEHDDDSVDDKTNGQMHLSIESFKPDDPVHEILGSVLLSFCEKHCPLKLTQTWSQALTDQRHHLLDLMYHLVVPENEKSETAATSEREGMFNASATDAPKSKRSSISAGIVTFKNAVNVLLTRTVDSLKKLKNLKLRLLRAFKSCIVGTLCMLDLFQCVSSETFTFETDQAEAEADLVVIPSVCELHSFGIRFKPTNGGIMAIKFDERKRIFYLPVIKLDVNSEVIMRNLVAYEALTKPDLLIFTRYIELMQAMIDTVEDVKMLKDAAIIESTSSINKEETVKLFNGMRKSIGPTKTEKLDKTIKKVNKRFHYNKKYSFTKFVYTSWKFFTLLGTFVLLVTTALQTFCTVYDCAGHFRYKSTNSFS